MSTLKDYDAVVFFNSSDGKRLYDTGSEVHGLCEAAVYMVGTDGILGECYALKLDVDYVSIVAGVGELNKDGVISRDSFVTAACTAMKLAMKRKYNKVAFCVPTEFKYDFFEVPAAVHEMNYAFDTYKKTKSHLVTEIAFCDQDGDFENFVNNSVNINDAIVAKGTHITRDLVMTPPNHQTPSKYVEQIEAIFSEFGPEITVTEIAVTDDFGGIKAVSAGSPERGKLLKIEYTPGSTDSHVTLVGKGLVFDSGGLNLKPSGSMAGMHTDMAGSAVAIGTIYACAKRGLNKHITALIPIADNKTGAEASRPGDIITMLDGTTVEIGNTDAEGRLILADAIAYAKQNCVQDIIIDIATLTGACVVALGEKLAGVMSNADDYCGQLVELSDDVGEYVHQLPMHKCFKGAIDSKVADIKNTSNIKGAGTITAAMFLEHFVGDTPWIHMDIAGVAYCDSETSPVKATGFGTKLLYHFIDNFEVR